MVRRIKKPASNNVCVCREEEVYDTHYRLESGHLEI
jgi:hypothetical protein